MNAAERHYGIVTAAYWGFTLTDGALRMLVLLHFYKLGYSPFTLAFLFLLYEGAGVLANLLAAGWPRALALHACSRWAWSRRSSALVYSQLCSQNGQRPCPWLGWCWRKGSAVWPKT